MKKILSIILIILCVGILFVGCGKKAQEKMTISPTEFSDETNEILNLLNSEVLFYDYALDEAVRSMKISFFEFENGKWVDKGGQSGNIDNDKELQIILDINETECSIIDASKHGHSKSTFKIETKFDEGLMWGKTKITNTQKIELNKEIPLFVKVGTDTNSLSMEIDDFRKINCTQGIAIVVTFSDKELD